MGRIGVICSDERLTITIEDKQLKELSYMFNNLMHRVRRISISDMRNFKLESKNVLQ